MGEGFQLESGVHYVVTFKVWPSQDAYDLVANLNNGVKVYEAGKPNSITPEEREQVVEMKAPTATEPGSSENKYRYYQCNLQPDFNFRRQGHCFRRDRSFSRLP